MATERDLLVVGGGPTGLATAIAAAQAGLETTVIEARDGVIDKACGEGLMPAAVDLLRGLGVQPAESHPFVGVRYVAGDHAVEGRFSGTPGLGVRRTVLHAALRRRAEELGVTWHHARAGAVAVTPDHVTVAGLRGRHLVAADGLRSPIREQLGLSAPARRSPRLGVRRHFARAPEDPFVQVHWSPRAEAYVTPVGPDLVGVAFLFYRDRVGPTPAGTPRFDDLLADFPALQRWLAGAEAASPVAGAGPFERRARRRVAGRVLLVGDAAGYLDPLTGEGLRLGFEAGQAAVQSILEGAPEAYERRWRRITRRYWWMTGGLLSVARSRLLRRALVPTLRLCPPVMSATMRLLAEGDGQEGAPAPEQLVARPDPS